MQNHKKKRYFLGEWKFYTGKSESFILERDLFWLSRKEWANWPQIGAGLGVFESAIRCGLVGLSVVISLTGHHITGPQLFNKMNCGVTEIWITHRHMGIVCVQRRAGSEVLMEERSHWCLLLLTWSSGHHDVISWRHTDVRSVYWHQYDVNRP